MSVDVIDKLNRICNPEKLHKVMKSSEGDLYKVVFKEANNKAFLREITISGLDHVIAIKYDEINLANKIFLTGHKSIKACDAVVFCQLEQDFYVLIFDMKSSTPSDDDHKMQLMSGLCFTDYLFSLLKNFEGIKIGKWSYRYFIFHCGNNKRETSPERICLPPNNHQINHPHILKVENGEDIPLRKLLGKPL